MDNSGTAYSWSLTGGLRGLEDRLIRYPWLVCVLAALWAGLICFPQFSSFREGDTLLILNWNALRAQIAHPLTPLNIDANFHAGQIGRRITMPVLAHVLGLRLEHLFLLQFALVPVFLRLVWKAVAQAASDRIALWAMLGLSCCFVTQTFWFDNVGNFDCFGYCFLAAALAARRWSWAALWLFLGLFCDERVYILAPVVMLWHQLGGADAAWDWNLKNLKPVVWALVVVTVVALGLREWLKQVYGLGVPVGQTGDLGLALIWKYWQNARYGLFSAFELGWVAVVLLPIMIYQKQKLLGVGMGGYLAVAVLATLSVIDESRSVSYLFPAVLLGWVLLERTAQGDEARLLGAFVAVGGLVIPPLVVVGPFLLEPPHGFFPGMWHEIAAGVGALWRGLPQ